MQKREGRRRDRIIPLSRNLGAHLAAGSRWLGAQAAAAVATLVSGDGAVEVAGTLDWSGALLPPSTSSCSYSRRPGSGGGVQEL